MEESKKKPWSDGNHTPKYLKKLEKKQREAAYKLYKKTELVELIAGVCSVPKTKVNAVFTALCDVLVELSQTGSIVQLPKVGRIVFEPQYQRGVWNPKEKRTLIYQNPKVSFRLSYKLRAMLRRQFRRNCYQLAELNNLTPRELKPPVEKETE